MRTKTITASEYATLYGCSTQFVSRQLRKDIGMTAMVGWKKSGGTWLIEVLSEWVESKTITIQLEMEGCDDCHLNEGYMSSPNCCRQLRPKNK